MSIITLAPNDNPMYTSSNWLLHNGSGNYYSILVDNTDDTFIHSMGGNNPIMYPITDMPVGFSFASSVTVHIRENNSGSPTDSFPIYVQIIDGADGITPLTTANFFPDASTIANYSVQLAVIGATDSATWNNALLKITTGPSSNTRVTNIYEISLDLTYNVTVHDDFGSSGSFGNGTVNDFQYTSNPVISLAASLGSGLAPKALTYSNIASTDGPELNGINRAYVNGIAINLQTYDIIASSGGVNGNSSTTKIVKNIYRPTIVAIGVATDGVAVFRTKFGPSSTKDGPKASGSADLTDNKTKTTTGVGIKAAGSVDNSLNHTETTTGVGVLTNGTANNSGNHTETTTGAGVLINGTAIVNTIFVIIGSSGAIANGYYVKLYVAGYSISGGGRVSGSYVLQQTYAPPLIHGGIRVFGDNTPDYIRPINTQPHRNYALLMKTPNILNAIKSNPNALINRDSKSVPLPVNRFEIKHQVGYCSFGSSCGIKNAYLPDIVKKRQGQYLPPADGSTVISNDQISTANGI